MCKATGDEQPLLGLGADADADAAEGGKPERGAGMEPSEPPAPPVETDARINERAPVSARMFTRTPVFRVAATALFTAAALLVTLRCFGLLAGPDTVRLSGGGHSAASVGKLQQVWDALSGDFYEDADEELMLDYAAAGMASSLGDIYTAYYTKDDMRLFTEHSAGTFHGIGVYVVANDDGSLLVTGFLEDSPALEAGVLAGDVIISVDGASALELADENRVVAMIKGPAGTKVRLGLHRASDGRELELTVERREIKAENIFSRVIHIDGSGAELARNTAGTAFDEAAEQTDKDGRSVGYIQLVMFDASAAEYFKRHLDELLAEGVSALVVDLRGNPGGDFDQVVAIADSLIGEAVIVYTEDRHGNKVVSDSDAASLGLPIRVLINAQSASASEILAGAVKDNAAGRLVGEKSFGKGLVQKVLTLADGSGLKYTHSRYFTPSGVCIQGTGIEPDLAVALPASYAGYSPSMIPEGEDAQLTAALGDLAAELN